MTWKVLHISTFPALSPISSLLLSGKHLLILRDPGKMLPSLWNSPKTPQATWITLPPSSPSRMHQFSSVAQSCLTLCDPMNCSTPGLPVCHKLPEFTQTHAHRAGDAIQPSHPLSSPSPPAPNPSQHQGLFQWVNSLHEMVKILEFQLQHQSFQWTPRTDLL